MRVFIADDSSLVRERLSAALSEIEGIEIVGQTSEAQLAVDFVRRLGPEVVIMDIMLHSGNGIDALRTIKRGDPVPIVLVFTNSPMLNTEKNAWTQERISSSPSHRNSRRCSRP